MIEHKYINDRRQYIKRRRQELGKTLEDVGREVGVSKATVQRWESGNITNMRRDKIYKLAQSLDTSPARLLGWESDPKEQSEPAVLDGKPLDEQDLKLLRLLRTMTPEEKDWLLDRIDALLALR